MHIALTEVFVNAMKWTLQINQQATGLKKMMMRYGELADNNN